VQLALLIAAGFLTIGAGPAHLAARDAARVPGPASPAVEPGRGPSPAVTRPQPISLAPVRLVYRQVEGKLLRGPHGVFVDPTTGEVYVADTMNDLVAVYSRDGVPLFAFGYNGELREPIKAVTDGRGRIYVLTGIGRAVKVFSYRGEYLEDFPFPGLDRPPVVTALTTDTSGNLYVADSASAQVLVYDADRRLALRVGEPAGAPPSAERAPGVPGRLQSPVAIALDRDGNIYVADAQAVPVQVFARDGRFLRGWGERAAGAQNFSLPSGLAVDPEGRLIVVDTLRQTIMVFAPDGHFLGRHGGLGSGPGAVSYPTDVASDGNGRLYVVERAGNRMQIFEQRTAAARGAPAPRSSTGERAREELNRSLGDLLRKQP
jgi:tripartite motif-containing protein 71